METKGTGHARQGSIRAPQWRHGGIVFAPKPRDYSYTVNKKEKRLAMKSAFSAKVIDNNMIILDKLTLDDYKTRDIVDMLSAVNANKKHYWFCLKWIRKLFSQLEIFLV